MPLPPPMAAKARPSVGLVGGTDLGVLSLLAAIVRVAPTPLGFGFPCAVPGLLYRDAPDAEFIVLDVD